MADPTGNAPSIYGGASDFEKIGLPIIALFIVGLIFFLVHAAFTWLPENKWWKKLTQNYENVEDDKATFLQKRRGSLRRKLRRSKDTSIARGNDGRGGVSTGEVSKSDFDQNWRRSRTDLDHPDNLSKAPSKSSIEANDEQPLNVAKFYNRAFSEDPEDEDDIDIKPILRNKQTNKNLEKYRNSAEFYSQFSLVPIENGEVGRGSVGSIDATVHTSVETLNESGSAPKPPQRKKYMSTENLNNQHGQNRRHDNRRRQPMAVSMQDLRTATSMSFSDLRQREYEEDKMDARGQKQTHRALAKSVEDVRRSQGRPANLSAYESAENISKTYGGSDGYLNHKSDYNRQSRSAANSVDDMRRVSGYNHYDNSNQYVNNNYSTGNRSHDNQYSNHGDNRHDNRYDRNGLAVHKSATRSTGDLQIERQYQQQRDTNARGSLPGSASSSRQSLESHSSLSIDSRSYQGSQQSLDSNGQPRRPPNGRKSFANPRASRRARRKAPVPNGMPDIPENLAGSAYGKMNSTNSPAAVLPTSHVNYDMSPYGMGSQGHNQGSAKV